MLPNRSTPSGLSHPSPHDAAPNANLHLGIDVGGTNVKIGIIDPFDKLVAETSTPTPPLQTPERVFQFAIAFAKQRTASLPGTIRSVGLAVPGVLDQREYALREVVNLPGWVDRPLLELLQANTGLPAAVLNDANAAAFAEHNVRDLGTRSLALVTLGTGIGCGVVIAGQPYGGDHGSAGELGHIAIRFGEEALPCTCGSRGHLETYAGSAGVLQRLRQRLMSEPSTKEERQDVSDLSHGEVTPKDLTEAAMAGNSLALVVIDETAMMLGQGIGLLCQSIDPEVVLLGGAMTFGGESNGIGQRFLKHVRQSVRETTLVQVGQKVRIEFASLAGRAGMMGAAIASRAQIFQT